MEETIKLLKEMREELLRKVAALDSAISVLQDIQKDIEPSSVSEEVKPKPRRRKKPVVDDIDFSCIPDFNPNGGGIRLDK